MGIIIKSLIVFLFVFSIKFSFAQHRVSGFVKDAQTGEMLIGATIFEQGTTNGTATNQQGYFSLIASGKPLAFSFIGYQGHIVEDYADTLLTVFMLAGQDIEEVKVFGQFNRKFNVATLNSQELTKIPSIGGKPDVVKTLQLLPGIQSQAEGTGLLNVRGGNPGENLYLIDNIPLIYVNHLGGFMSVFNPDMINNIEVYKGGFPAKYGGKLSSILSITQREGDIKKWKGNLGIGVTDVSFSVEGPLIKDKASIIVTGRKTLTDALMILASGLTGGDYFTFYGFHDINAKISYRPDNKNSFHLNIYHGDDYIRFWAIEKSNTLEKAQLSNVWGNNMVSGRWSRQVSPSLFVNNTISTTHYRLGVRQLFTSKSQNDTIDFSKHYHSSVRDVSFRSDWQYRISNSWQIDFGAKATQYLHIPNQITQSTQQSQPETEKVNSTDNALYFDNRLKFFNTFEADLGLRFVNYKNGSYSINSMEPRLSLNLNITPKHQLNFSGQRVTQFAHLLFTSGSIMNNEIWVPANEQLPASSSVQLSAGWRGSFANEMFESELNIYHKTLSDLASYKEGYSNLLGDGGWHSKIEKGGEGKSSGLELMFKKNKGLWTGFAAYTLSHTTRKFDGINRGQEYVFEYDRPHAFSINMNRKLNEKWNINLLWVYQTGLPYTPVIGRQYVQRSPGQVNEALIYGERNSARMRDYHRLDVGATYQKTTKMGRKAEWTFSVYNLYNRMNPNSYFYSSTEENRMFNQSDEYKPIKLYQMSFFPIIPSVSYRIYFEKNQEKERIKLSQKLRNYFYYEN